MKPTKSNPTSKRTSEQNEKQQESESEWTHLSISSLQQPHSSTHLQHNPNLEILKHPSNNPENVVASSEKSLFKISDLQLLTQPNQFLGESDSSTNFDPQSWKRGDTGTTKRPKRTSYPSTSNTDHHQQSNRDSPERPSVPSSQFVDAAFLSPTQGSKSSLDNPSIQRRRATSTTRRASRPIIYQSNSISTPNRNEFNPNSRPSSDLGPSRKNQILSNRTCPPTWKAYAGKEATSSSTRLTEADRKQEFVEALANLRAMARTGKLNYISSNSSHSNIRDNNDDHDDSDPDEPQPDHADMPTSTFNSAVDEQEADQPNLINPPDDPRPNLDSNFYSSLSRFFRWSGYIGTATSLKTWQLVGLGGLIFGIGIWAGSSIGRNFSHQKYSNVFKLYR